jgi:ATP phosphoribosyltransferase regulatory subunit
MSAWVLPDHIADVLPSEARHIEELRRQLLDTARSYGFELVMPPLLEHLDSLLTGTGEALGLQTFKLVDQLSGRTLGLRADTTPQAARIDAHLLNRRGVARLCYCGPVLHTRPAAPHATREPLQFGAELFGHAGHEADLEVLLLAIDCLRAAGLRTFSVDLADVRILRTILADAQLPPAETTAVHAAVAAKDGAALRGLTRGVPAATREALLALVQLYGGAEVLFEAEKALKSFPETHGVLSNLKWLAQQLTLHGGAESASGGGIPVSFDLADLRGYAYYSGARFSVYAPGAADALVRGGRYDEVGAVFGRNRPAVGFSLDVKSLVAAVPQRPLRAAIRAAWVDAPGQRTAIAGLRAAGETVVCVLPGHETEVDEFACDRVLREAAGRWVVQPA